MRKICENVNLVSLFYKLRYSAASIIVVTIAYKDVIFKVGNYRSHSIKDRFFSYWLLIHFIILYSPFYIHHSNLNIQYRMLNVDLRSLPCGILGYWLMAHFIVLHSSLAIHHSESQIECPISNAECLF